MTVNLRGHVAGDDVREAKGLLRKVIRDNEEHSGARLCLAQTLAEEGGAAHVFALRRTQLSIGVPHR